MPRKAALFVLPLVASLAAPLSLSAAPPISAALGLKPIQEGVEYEQVPESQYDSCKLKDLEGDWNGWEVSASDGSTLRRFADTNGDKKVDLWSYFKDGVEVYRDVDADFNGKADQYRWLGTAGIRWGMDDDEDGKIESWKQISAEEATAELIAALASGDEDRFQRLLLTPKELGSLGFEKAEAEKLGSRITRASEEFKPFAARQKVVGSDAKWVQFAAAKPGVVPAGDKGLKVDLVVYENAVAMFESADKPGQLVVGTLVRLGQAWRLIDLPQIVGEDQIARSSGYFFNPVSSAVAAMPAGAGGEQAQKLVAQLEKIDLSLATASAADKPKLNATRADIVEKLAAAASSPEERQTWIQQLVDTVAAAVQEGTYPGGIDRLNALSKGVGSKDAGLRSYIGFQIVSAEYAARLQGSKPEDFAKIQEWYLEELNKFVSENEGSPEAGQAMMQLALSKEFEADEAEALKWYRRVAKEFSGIPAGEKAAGAVRRLESVGKVLELEGETLDGKNFQLSRLRGKPVVIHYWATWCEPCKQDMRRLRQLQAQYQRAGLQVVGISVDGRREDAEAFLKSNPLPWPQLFSEGGLESSRLANELGVQTLPTMLLVDEKGKVVRHNVQVAQLGEELDGLR